MTVIADTGALYALVDASDVWHARVIDSWRTHGKDVLVPVTVLPEVTYLLATRIGPAAEEAFVKALADGEFVLEPLEDEDIARAVALVKQYADMPLGFVDATLIAMMERLQARQLLTTDRRHFGVVRPRHARSLVLLP